jgi:putative RecB family exonuclease
VSIWENFRGLRVELRPPDPVRPRFSLTSDILSFRRCTRQYRFFSHEGFVPARATQAFYGTVVHQVLDRCHRLYNGKIEGRAKGSLPTDDDIDTFADDVQNALRSHGVWALNGIDEKARKVLKTFNSIEGQTLYPRMRQTEYRLERDREDFVLRGVVDVIARAEDADADPDGPYDPSDMEIWDYKGSKRVGLSAPIFRDYEWQMLVYADLYRLRTGVFPARAVLYFLNELDDVLPTALRPDAVLHYVDITEDRVREAIDRFDTSARTIMQCQNTGVWPDPEHLPDNETCSVCDVRYGCDVRARFNAPPYEIREPFPEAGRRPMRGRRA